MTAVCLGGPPSADLGRRRLFEPEGVLIQTELEPRARHALRLHTNSCASCASAVFAIATALIAPRSSHRTRPVPLSSLRAHPSALIALFATEDRCTHIDRVRTAISVLLCVRIRMSRSLPQSILFSEFKLSIFVSLPPDLERGGLRSPIGHCDCALHQTPRPRPTLHSQASAQMSVGV